MRLLVENLVKMQSVNKHKLLILNILICIAEVILLGEGDSYRVSPDDRRVIHE